MSFNISILFIFVGWHYFIFADLLFLICWNISYLLISYFLFAYILFLICWFLISYLLIYYFLFVRRHQTTDTAGLSAGSVCLGSGRFPQLTCSQLIWTGLTLWGVDGLPAWSGSPTHFFSWFWTRLTLLFVRGNSLNEVSPFIRINLFTWRKSLKKTPQFFSWNQLIIGWTLSGFYDFDKCTE